MIILDYRDRRPIYEQVISRFQELMLTGALEKDSQLPSVRSLAMELAINPNTIQRAYRELEAEGYILSMPGKGSFVADATDLERQKRLDAEHALRAAAQSLAALGYGPDKLDALWAQMREELEP